MYCCGRVYTYYTHFQAIVPGRRFCATPDTASIPNIVILHYCTFTINKVSIVITIYNNYGYVSWSTSVIWPFIPSNAPKPTTFSQCAYHNKHLYNIYDVIIGVTTGTHRGRVPRDGLLKKNWINLFNIDLFRSS